VLLEIRMVQEVTWNGRKNPFINLHRTILFHFPAVITSSAELRRDRPLQGITLKRLQPCQRYRLSAGGTVDAVVGPAQISLPFVFRLRLSFRLPLHVARRVRSTVLQRLYVVDDVAWASSRWFPG
jgi:hypothetical protein